MMKFQLQGDVLVLPKYLVSYTLFDEKMEDVAIDDEHLAELQAKHEDLTFEEQDLTDKDWLQGKIFTNEQYNLGWVEKALECTQDEYLEFLKTVDKDTQIATLQQEVLSLSATNEMLEDCIVELATAIYGG